MMDVVLPYTREFMLGRMLAADPTADGHFITGVSSTGIYCLPSCRARKPLPKNVVFFESPFAARQAGLRACQRCRPDEFYAGTGTTTLALARLHAVEIGSVRGVEELCTLVQLSRRQLASLLRREVQMTPATWITRQRVEQAASLLLKGDASVARIAFTVGFESLSVFNAQFRQHKATTPNAFRRSGKGSPQP